MADRSLDMRTHASSILLGFGLALFLTACDCVPPPGGVDAGPSPLAGTWIATWGHRVGTCVVTEPAVDRLDLPPADGPAYYYPSTCPGTRFQADARYDGVGVEVGEVALWGCQGERFLILRATYLAPDGAGGLAGQARGEDPACESAIDVALAR